MCVCVCVCIYIYMVRFCVIFLGGGDWNIYGNIDILYTLKFNAFMPKAG